DPAAGDDDRRSPQLEVRDLLPVRSDSPSRVAGREHPSADADHGTVLGDQAVHAVAEGEVDQPGGLGGLDGLAEDPHHLGAGAPGEVEAGYGIAVLSGPGTAAFGPADARSQTQAQLAQVLPLLTGGEFEVRLGPRPRPAVLVAVESRRGGPVGRSQLEGVAGAEAALLGGVDEEEPAE